MPMSSDQTLQPMPWTAWFYPVLAVCFYFVAAALGFGDTFTPSPVGIALALALAPVLFGAVFAAVHHAEVIAHRTGEPFGTLVLTAAVTVIEVALITSVMLKDPDGSPALARDTIFAVVMTVCTGLTGLCLLVGGLRYREQSFTGTGASVYLSVLLVLATLTLILPNYTRSTAGPSYSGNQLAFIGVMTLILYGAFLYIQTVRHREYFIAGPERDSSEGGHGVATATVAISVALLFVALIGVILLSKKFAAVVETTRVAIHAPATVTGLVVAILVLLPEGLAAVQAARKDELQKSLNLALGSSLATIGMTFPAVAVVGIYLGKPLTIGLDAADSALLALTLVVSILTLGSGRTNVLYGAVHLVIFASFLFFTFFP
jgi:Ca2+:H+ antiporter